MPVYEYACTTCGERTEARQSFDDPPLEECPICGGPLRKLYSPVGIVFKGSGFYSTESKKSSHRDGQTGSTSNSDKGDKQKSKKEGSPSSDPASGSSSSSGSGSGSGSGSESASSSSSGSEAKSS